MSILKTQKTEKYLSALQVVTAVAGPITISLFMDNVHWFWKCHMILALMVFVVWINYFRGKISKTLKGHFNNLQAGAVLGSRTPHEKNRFIVTRSSPSHYHLKTIETGKHLLISRSRVQDEFEILH